MANTYKEKLLNISADYFQANHPQFNFLIGQTIKELKKRNLNANIKDIREMLVKEFLKITFEE